MEGDMKEEILAQYLERSAYVYVRRSSRAPASESLEGIERERALVGAVVALGWKEEQVIPIAWDVGLPGRGARRDGGFRRLLEDVRVGRAGIVAALDISRLAREPSECSVLVESCALGRTLLLVDGAMYDPSRPEDRMLLAIRRSLQWPGFSCRRRRSFRARLAPAPGAGGSNERGARVPGLLARPLHAVNPGSADDALVAEE